MSRMKGHGGNLILSNVIEVKEKFITSLDVKDFAGLFEVDVRYLDMSLKENEDKQPIDLGITSINIENGEFVYDSEKQQLHIQGDIVIFDGVKKFDIMKVHPESKINIMITTFSKEELRAYLSSTNTTNKQKE